MANEAPLGDSAIGDTIFGPDYGNEFGVSAELRIIYARAESRTLHAPTESRILTADRRAIVLAVDI